MAKSSNGKYKRINTNHSKGKPYGTLGYGQQRPLKQGSGDKMVGNEKYRAGTLKH
jgi:hypothetical protein